jgi:hypothetical protein
VGSDLVPGHDRQQPTRGNWFVVALDPHLLEIAEDRGVLH